MTTPDTLAERAALLFALAQYCTCETAHGMLLKPCPGHKALAEPGDRLEHHFAFARYLAVRCVAEEFCVHPSRVDDECVVCGDIRLTSEFSFQTLKAADLAA